MWSPAGADIGLAEGLRERKREWKKDGGRDAAVIQKEGFAERKL